LRIGGQAVTRAADNGVGFIFFLGQGDGFIFFLVRHLLGLRIMAMASGLPTPRIFQEEGWNTDFLLTTSQSPIVQEHLKVAQVF
jgi:hypothetical protein